MRWDLRCPLARTDSGFVVVRTPRAHGSPGQDCSLIFSTALQAAFRTRNGSVTRLQTGGDQDEKRMTLRTKKLTRTSAAIPSEAPRTAGKVFTQKAFRPENGLSLGLWT